MLSKSLRLNAKNADECTIVDVSIKIAKADEYVDLPFCLLKP